MLLRGCTRGLVVVFGLIIGVLSGLPFYLGGVLLSRGSTQFLATPLPSYLPWALIGAGVLLLAKFVTALRGACSPQRKLSLAFTMIITLILMVFSACACAMAFEVQKSVVDPSTHNVFIGHFFSAVRHRFERMFRECQPAAYLTDTVNDACDLLAPATQRACTLNPPDRAGVYCTAGPGLSPFTLNTTLHFTRLKMMQALMEELAVAHSAGWWVSAMCMPRERAYRRELRALLGENATNSTGAYALEAASGVADEGSGAVAEGGGGDDEYPTFAECYGSSWWETAPPTAGAGFSAQPDGAPLPAEEAGVYEALGPSWPLSPKMLYCFCGSSRRNLRVTLRLLDATKYGLLGLALASLLALVGEAYLVCRDDEDDDWYDDDDVDTAFPGGRRPREYPGMRLCDEPGARSHCASSSSTARGYSARDAAWQARDEQADAAWKEARAKEAEWAAGVAREHIREGGGGGGGGKRKTVPKEPSFEERRALEMEREAFETRMAEERARRDAENAARLAAYQAEKLAEERAAKHARKVKTRALKMVGIKTKPKGPKKPKVESWIDPRTGEYIEGKKPGKAKRVLNKIRRKGKKRRTEPTQLDEESYDIEFGV